MNFANEEDSSKTSSTSHQKPRLNMEHGFLRAIEHSQHSRERQAKEESRRHDGKPSRRAPATATAFKTTKPTLEYYQVPNRRSGTDFGYVGGGGIKSPVNGNGDTDAPSESPPPAPPTHVLSKSSSTTHARVVHFQLPGPSRHPAPTSTPAPSPFGLKRSKSLGAGDLLKVRTNSDFDLNGYELDAQMLLRRAIDDPNSLPTLKLMEAVRHLFTRLLEGTRYAESSARICIAITEKEKNATFLESLLNTCREWYRERNRLVSGPLGASRWLAYVTFLYELYGRTKTRGVGASRVASSTSNPEVPPQTTLLTLLSECCIVLLQPPSVHRLADVECLFFVLTSLGRDLQSELPQRMQAVLVALRDAFMDSTVPKQVKKTLLQLIELHASKWQLPAPAVMYYYPGRHDRS